MRSLSLLLLLVAACDGPKDGQPADTDTDAGEDTGCVQLADGSCVTDTWVDLPELEAVDGVYTLTLAPTELILAGQRHCGRAYNGVYPAPTLVTEASSSPRSVRIDLHNAFTDHAYHSLDGDDTCACTDSTGAECLPHGHGGCDTEAEDDCTCTNSDGEVCDEMFDFNLTNLHFHGSHIRPDAAEGGGCTPDGDLACRDCDADACDGNTADDMCFYSDDVLNQVHPGEGARYRLDLDEDGTHHAGLNWYHPHIHGTTAIQVASGAAGAWVIRGGIDDVPGLANARERVMVYTNPPIGDGGFTPLADGEACTEDTLTFDNTGVLGSVTAGEVDLVNGVEKPRMVVPPGQVERWRVVSASFLDEAWMGIYRGNDSDCTSWSTAEADTLELTQYARDGITMPQTFSAPYWFMSSGYRIEGWVGGDGVFEDGDTWCLVAAHFLQEADDGEPVSPDEEPSASDVEDLLSVGNAIGIINVTSGAGNATETTPPTAADLAAEAPTTDIDGRTADDLCAEGEAVQDAEEVDEGVVLQVGGFTADEPDPCGCGGHNVDCNEFQDIDRGVYPYDRDLPLGATEHWVVRASNDGHPFHIHINPYLVCPNDNPFDPLPFAHWRDTYLVNLDRRVDLVTKYRAFTGAFVLHCHKLTHEDDGMMQLLRVCDPATDPTCGTYGWRHCAEGDLTCIQHLAATDCAIEADNAADAFACTVGLGGPGEVCGADACGSDDDCGPGTHCEDYVCAPGP
jgi:FtsP/CotA-like multicopper oxidase with cupredoxin domain